MNRRKRILKAFTVLFVVLILFIGLQFVLYPPAYAFRVFSMLGADTGDMDVFPERTILHDDAVFTFNQSYQIERVLSMFESSEITDFEDFLEDRKTLSFIVIQNDNILYENYFGGSREDRVTSFSVAKSFTSTLVGIAIDEGAIESIDDPITMYLPELAERDDDFSKITIKNLLMMNSGISYHETGFVNGDDSKTYYWPDLQELGLEMTEIEGLTNEVFHYNNYHPLLLGIILERATGMSVSKYMETKLWGKIGTEFDASWSLDEEGFEKMESGINARPIDFAKFGRLMLNNGSWNGNQILSNSWVNEATTPDLSVTYDSYYSEYGDYIFDDGNGFYKYFWWGISTPTGRDFFALGNLGQFIYISPDNGLIILRNGETYGSFDGSLTWINIFHDFASNFEI